MELALVYTLQGFCFRFLRCSLFNINKNAFLMAEAHFTIYEDSLNSVQRFMAHDSLVFLAHRLLQLTGKCEKCVSSIIVDALCDFYYPFSVHLRLLKRSTEFTETNWVSVFEGFT